MDVKASTIATLITISIFWLSPILQNTVVFFSTFLLFLILLIWKTGWRADRKYLQRIFDHTTFRFIHNLTMSSSKIGKIADDKVLTLVDHVVKNKKINFIQEKISSDAKKEIARSGKAHNTRILAKRSIAFMIITFFVLVPVSILLGFLFNPILFLLPSSCLLWLTYPKIKLRLQISDRKYSIENELPFFTLYASIMQSVGQSLYFSMIAISETGIFPSIKIEGLMLSRNIKVFGMDPITALNEHGYSHPNALFRDFLLGYVSIAKSGGNLSLFMEKKAEEFFQKMQFQYKNYNAKANLIGETMLILLTILPTMILVSSFLLANNSTNVVMGLSLIFVPTATIFIILSINHSQPKIRNEISIDVSPFILAFIAMIITIMLDEPIWFVIAASVSVGGTANIISCWRRFREVSLTEGAIVDFFRDVTEFRKIGITIPNAIIRISEERNYNQYFDQLILFVSSQLKQGISLTDALCCLRIRSWIVRVSFHVLGKISETGGGNPEILEQMTQFFTKINQIKKETQSGISPIAYFATSGPIMMSYTAKEMIEILEKLNSGGGQISQSVFNIQPLMSSNELIGAINLLNVISSISLGLIMSKLTYFTMKHTFFLAIITIVSILSIMLAFLFPSII